jgi:hypothetical protein
MYNPNRRDRVSTLRAGRCDATFLDQLDEIVDERMNAAAKRQRDQPTQCGMVQHAGFTCREFDAYLRRTIEAGGDLSGAMASMLEQHQGYDPIL